MRSLRSRLAALALLVGIALGSGTVRAEDPLAAAERHQQQLFERIAPSVVFLSNGRSFGSGFFVNASGLVLTNAHVVGDRAKLRAVLHDGREFEAQVVKKAPHDLDLALVQLPMEHTTALPFSDMRSLRVGSWVASVGHGRGGVWTFNTGMVSNIYPSGTERPVFQTQIPLNPGSSGGPLFDREGRVVGIVTSGMVDSNSINFGIKADVALAAFEELRKGRALRIIAPAGVAVFVDGKHVGQGPLIEFAFTAQHHEVMAVIGGRMVKQVVDTGTTGAVELK